MGQEEPECDRCPCRDAARRKAPPFRCLQQMGNGVVTGHLVHRCQFQFHLRVMLAWKFGEGCRPPAGVFFPERCRRGLLEGDLTFPAVVRERLRAVHAAQEVAGVEGASEHRRWGRELGDRTYTRQSRHVQPIPDIWPDCSFPCHLAAL